MTRGTMLILSLSLFAPAAARAADPGDTKKLAQDILTKGAALFDTRDAAVMAATYTEDASLSLVSKDKDTGRVKSDETRGRTGIEQFYANHFKDRKPGTVSRNDVDFAHFAGPDILIIHGTFAPNVDERGAFPFVQVRVKEGEKWRILNIQVFLESE